MVRDGRTRTYFTFLLDLTYLFKKNGHCVQRAVTGTGTGLCSGDQNLLVRNLN